MESVSILVNANKRKRADMYFIFDFVSQKELLLFLLFAVILLAFVQDRQSRKMAQLIDDLQSRVNHLENPSSSSRED